MTPTLSVAVNAVIGTISDDEVDGMDKAVIVGLVVSIVLGKVLQVGGLVALFRQTLFKVVQVG